METYFSLKGQDSCDPGLPKPRNIIGFNKVWATSAIQVISQYVVQITKEIENEKESSLFSENHIIYKFLVSLAKKHAKRDSWDSGLQKHQESIGFYKGLSDICVLDDFLSRKAPPS